MKEFKREDKYLVIKRSDILKYLNYDEQFALSRMTVKINSQRISNGKESIEGVIAKKGTPEYESVWNMIEERLINKHYKGE